MNWKIGFLTAASAMAGASALAQVGYNIDVDDPHGGAETGAGAPSSSYPAASPGQSGLWCAFPSDGGFGTPFALHDVNGNLTGATLAMTSGWGSSGGWNVAGWSGDWRLLMADGADVGIPMHLQFNGIAPGHYELITYAGNPLLQLQIPLFVYVVGSSTPTQTITGPDPNMAFTYGVDYCVHDIVTSGSIEVVLTSNGPPNPTVHGFQLIPVPEPTAISALVLGLALSALRRRRV